MKCFAVIILSFSLFHAGIAWTLQGCSLHWEHSEHSHLNPGKPNHSNLPTGSSATIHCLKSNLEVGPILQSSRVRIHRPFSDGVSLKKQLGLDARNLPFTTKIHLLKFPVIRFNPILYSTNQSLHLVLTVFQI